MNKSIQSKSNPRTPVNQNKYQQNYNSNFQQSSGQFKLSANENSNKASLIEQQIPQSQPQNGYHQLGIGSDNHNNNNEIYYPRQQINNMYAMPINLMGTSIEDNSKNKQTFVSTSVNSQNISEIIPSKSNPLTPNNNPQFQRNHSQISLSNNGGGRVQLSQKGSQDNLLTTKKLHSIVSTKNSKVGSSVNIQNYTSEQIQKHTSLNLNNNIPQFQLQPNLEQNKLFSDLIGQQQQQYLHQDITNKDYENAATFNFLLQQNDTDHFLKRHSPIQIEVPNQNNPSNNKGIGDSQDYTPLLKSNKYSSNSLLNFQKNNNNNSNNNNASKTPLRKTANTSKVSLNATPNNQSIISHDNQKKAGKSSQKSALKIIQDSSSFNSYLQQQKQQGTGNAQQEMININNKYGSQSFISQNGQANAQQKQNNNTSSFCTNIKNNNSSQQINPMISISIQSSNSINQVQQNSNEQQQNIQEIYEKQFYQNNQNHILQGKKYDTNLQNNEPSQQQQRIGFSLQQVTQFSSTCDSSQQSTNRFASKNAPNKSNVFAEQNPQTQTPILYNLKRKQNSDMVGNLQKPSTTQEEDYSVPQELQNSFQMNRNMSKLQNLTTIRASEIDLLKTTEKLNLSQQKFIKPHRESTSSHQSRGEIEKIQLNIIQNNITLNNQNIPKSESQSKLNVNLNQQKLQIYRGKENRKDGLNNLFSPPTNQQQNIMLMNVNHMTSVNGTETQRQFNRQSIDSFLDVTTKNIPQTFISQEKQSKLSMQHKNKSHRRNCNCDGDQDLMDSCSKVYGWLGTQKGQNHQNSIMILSLDSAEFDFKMLSQIQKDVMRTYQNYEYFWNPQIQSAIQNILYKYTKSNPEVGYIIWHADENCAFDLLTKICKILNLNDLLKPGFPDLQKHLKCIEVLMLLNCPQIYQILNKYDLHPSMFISEWILALLTDIIPLEFSFYVLDGIIKQGWIFIYRVVINLMKILLKFLENLDDQSEILYVLKSVRSRQKEYQINWQQVLLMQEPYISNELVEQILNHVKINAIE